MEKWNKYHFKEEEKKTINNNKHLLHNMNIKITKVVLLSFSKNYLYIEKIFQSTTWLVKKLEEGLL